MYFYTSSEDILHHKVSTVVQNMGLLRLQWLRPDIAAAKRCETK